MSVLLDPRFWLVLGGSAAATWSLARLAPRLGWVDASAGREAARKLQRRAVPCVGGPALLFAWLLAPVALHSDPMTGSVGTWAALVLVLAVGVLDDLQPLRPLPKLGLQVLALFPYGLTLLAGGGPLEALGWFLLVLAALNVANTFDNADGALGSVAALGFAFTSPWGLAALLGFLPWNLDARVGPFSGESGSRRSGGASPTAYLGDGGSFLVAFLLVLHPPALAALWIPALDLARLSVVRLAVGSRPWVGDRRHLAHRLQARGFAPVQVAALLVLLALPGCAGVWLEARFPGAAVLGLLMGAIGFLAVLRWAARPSWERQPA